MSDELTTIDLSCLETVTGGRYQKGPPQVDPKLIQAIAELAKSLQSVGTAKVQAGQAQQGQMMQFIQELMAKKGGK